MRKGKDGMEGTKFWLLILVYKEYFFYNQVISTIVSYRTSLANRAVIQSWSVYIAILLLFFSGNETIVSILENPESFETVPSFVL